MKSVTMVRSMQLVMFNLIKNQKFKMKKLLLVGLMMLSSFSTFAQISGKVVDSDGKQPLPGATILVQGR